MEDSRNNEDVYWTAHKSKMKYWRDSAVFFWGWGRRRRGRLELLQPWCFFIFPLPSKFFGVTVFRVAATMLRAFFGFCFIPRSSIRRGWVRVRWVWRRWVIPVPRLFVDTTALGFLFTHTFVINCIGCPLDDMRSTLWKCQRRFMLSVN